MDQIWDKSTKDNTAKIELEILAIFVVFSSVNSFKSIFFTVPVPLI